MSELVERLRRMAENCALPIGAAWNALDAAADALEEAQACLREAIVQETSWRRSHGIHRVYPKCMDRWRRAAGMRESDRSDGGDRIDGWEEWVREQHNTRGAG